MALRLRNLNCTIYVQDVFLGLNATIVAVDSKNLFKRLAFVKEGQFLERRPPGMSEEYKYFYGHLC